MRAKELFFGGLIAAGLWSLAALIGVPGGWWLAALSALLAFVSALAWRTEAHWDRFQRESDFELERTASFRGPVNGKR